MISVPAFIYAVLTLILLGIHVFVRDMWPVNLWANFMPINVLSAMFAALLLIPRKRWLGILFLGLFTVTFVGLYGRYFTPRLSADTTNSSRQIISVLTFNLGSDIADTPADQVVDSVLDAQADILAFQEVNARHAQVFADRLIDEYPYQIIYAAGEGTLGIALLSRYPVIRDDAFYGELGFLPYIDATLDIGGTHIKVINVHPAPPVFLSNSRYVYRSRGINDARLFAEKATTGIPTLLLGDMNATDQSQEYRILAASLEDSFFEAGQGFGFTYPANRPYGYTQIPSIPLFRLDYIWHTHHFETLDAQIGTNAGSDHLPVIARLSLETN